MNEVEREFKGKGNVSKKFTIPMLFWDEWEEDCRLNFNNTYHLKMQFDHEFKKQFQNIANLLMGDVVELQNKVFELEGKLEDIINNGVQTPKCVEKDSNNESGVAESPSKVRKTFGN